MKNLIINGNYLNIFKIPTNILTFCCQKRKENNHSIVNYKSPNILQNIQDQS